MTTAAFSTLPMGATFEIEGARWVKTDVQRAKPDNGPGPSCLIFGPARVKLVDRQRTYRHWGLDFAILAEYQDNDEGTALSNAFMTENPGTGVLAVDGGRIIIAALNDKGTKP